MRRAAVVLALPILVVLAMLALPGLLLTSVGAPIHATQGLAIFANSSSSANPTVDGITCPEPAINVLGVSMNCVSLLDLTEAFVIMFTVVITLYVFKDADRAELPGEAASIPVTADEELALRITRDREDDADRNYREKVAKGGQP